MGWRPIEPTLVGEPLGQVGGPSGEKMWHAIGSNLGTSW